MKELILNNDVDSILPYLESRAVAMSLSSDFDGFDRMLEAEYLNPDMQDFLSKEGFLEDEIELNIKEFSSLNSLFFVDSINSYSIDKMKFKRGFKKLKKKIHQAFCAVIGDIDWSQFDTKAIIRLVIIAIIPALGAAAGLPIIVLPIIIALVASLIKYGIGKVCPI
ncbi:hypothetical protein SAMN06298216_0168 [Spirosomataceae bacterium TFI 002]|nr:hypothetical protein SAMN06298216_0168 [Spirosomataceae bacterium TFI 002]